MYKPQPCPTTSAPLELLIASSRKEIRGRRGELQTLVTELWHCGLNAREEIYRLNAEGEML